MTADPENLGPYRIVRRAGVGGMGVVYEAVHTGLDKRVALKVLPQELAAGRLDRFLREARTAAALHHTNIVPVFDVGQVDGVPYYAMQFIDGRPLAAPSNPRRETHEPLPDPVTRTHDPAPETGTKTLPPGGTTADHDPASGNREVAGNPRVTGDLTVAARPDPKAVVSLILQAAEGLAYAHARGVVHRDIKPSNLILDADGVLWVADFGLAFRTDDPTLTTEGSILGTPRYMSPEQARAEKTDCRTDVYSLGVTLYELLTGTVAFSGDTPMGVVRKVLTHTPPRPRALNRDIPRDLETVVLKAMAKSPADRYASGRELADDLKRFLAGEPVKARRITPIGKAWRWAKRNPAVASLLAAVLVVFAAGAGVSMYFAERARERERQAQFNEGRANDNAEDARRKEAEATAAKNAVLTAEAANRRWLYTARINLASVALRERRYARVEELLYETFPKTGEEDFRGWEWHYLFRQIYSESRVRPLTGVLVNYVNFKAYPDRLLTVNTFDGVEGVYCRVYDPETGTLIRQAGAPATFDTSNHLPTGGSRHLLFADRAGDVIWNVDAGAVGAMLPAGQFPTALSPDGSRYARVIRAPDDPTQPPPILGDAPAPAAIEVWGVNPVRRLFVLSTPERVSVSEVAELRFSPDGRWLGMRSPGRRYLVWDLTRGKLRLDRPAPAALGREEVMNVPYLRFGGRRVAVLAADSRFVEVHDLTEPGADPARFGGFRSVVGLAFDPAGRRLAVGDGIGELHVFDLDGLEPPQVFRSTSGEFYSLVFSPDGRRVLSYVSNDEEPARVREWDLDRPRCRRAPAYPKGGVWFDPAGDRLLAAVENPDDPARRRIELWDAATLARRAVLTAPDATAGGCEPDWSADGKRIAMCEGVPTAALGFLPPVPFGLPGLVGLRAADTHVYRLVVLDAQTGARVSTTWLGLHRPSLVWFSPCGRFVAARNESVAVLIELATGRPVVTYRAPPAPYREEPDEDGGPSNQFGFVFLADPTRLAFARDDPETREFVADVWGETPGGWTKREFCRDRRFDWKWVSRTPDGRWLVVDGVWDGRQERQALLCDTMTGERRLYPTQEGTAVVSGRNEIYVDRHRLWVISNRVVRTMAVGSWQPGPTLTGDEGYVGSVNATPDGRRVLVRYEGVGLHPQIKVWDAGTGQELVTIPQTLDLPNDDGVSIPGVFTHFDGNRYTFVRPGANGEFEIETLDGTPVPDAVARERLDLK